MAVIPLSAKGDASKIADVYLFAGQSNMWGTGTDSAKLPPELAGVQKDIMIFKFGNVFRKEGWYPLENGWNNNYAGKNLVSEAQLTHDLVAIAENKPIYINCYHTEGRNIKNAILKHSGEHGKKLSRENQSMIDLLPEGWLAFGQFPVRNPLRFHAQFLGERVHAEAGTLPRPTEHVRID